jgi:hypothetical protein
VINTSLGINPDGHFYNAVDIGAINTTFTLEQEDPKFILHTQYRWRQTVSQKSFEKVSGVWKQVYHTVGSLPDDPDSALQKSNPGTNPRMYMYDSPGWPVTVGPATPTLDLGGGVKSSAGATEIAVMMYLIVTIEGLNKAGNWERVDMGEFEWCSVQWLQRATPASNWQTTSHSKLVSGAAAAMAEYGKSPDDIEI